VRNASSDDSPSEIWRNQERMSMYGTKALSYPTLPSLSSIALALPKHTEISHCPAMPPLPASLLGLPAEIRNEIYIYVFSSRSHVDDTIALALTDTKPLHNLYLLQTCHQIYHEAALLAYSKTTFITKLWRRKALEDGIGSSGLRKEKLSTLRSITLATHLTDNFLATGYGSTSHNAVTRRLVLFLEGLVTIPELTGLREVTVLFNDHVLMSILTKQNDVAWKLKHIMGAQFTQVEDWCTRVDPWSFGAVFMVTWEEGGKTRSVKVEFVRFSPKPKNLGLGFRQLEEGDVIKEPGLTSWEMRRKERPFLTAGQSDPAARMAMHTKSSFGRTEPRSPRSSLGGRSVRSSLNGDESWLSVGSRSSLGGLSARPSIGSGRPLQDGYK
jgi:hypothetical protein